MKYKKLWTDMHSNIHHGQMTLLPDWFEQAKELLDFWPIAYYPFGMRDTKWGLKVEDHFDEDVINADWEKIREFTKRVNEAGYPMFMGYEWQGTGKDGDHNVFFLTNDLDQKHPDTYRELAGIYKGKNVIAIPHHVAYQLGSRGKNWDTHDEEFSPFAEIYSSHGCSETDDGPLSMKRHIHMGPRTGETTYERAIDKGLHVGVIASGDNHTVPAVFEHGIMCALAEDTTKEAIWDALVNRRVYGVSQSRIEVEHTINGAPMGSVIETDGQAEMEIRVKGTGAIDRIEILKDNVLEHMVVHSGTWETKPVTDMIRFKFRVEFGWGPDIRVYKDKITKMWEGSLKVDGKLLSIEKCWNNFGQKLISQTEDGCEFSLTTYQSTATGKWMGPSNVTTEGFIFEVEADADSMIHLVVNGKHYDFSVRKLLTRSEVVGLWDEVEQLTRETWGDVTHYRDDPWWHNAYKFKLGRAYPESSYIVEHHETIQVEEDCCYRLRVWQKNNDVAWTSPIFVQKKK